MAALQSTEPVLDEETYDDTDFYELLLRDLIESNSTADRAPTLSTPSRTQVESPPQVPAVLSWTISVRPSAALARPVEDRSCCVPVMPLITLRTAEYHRYGLVPTLHTHPTRLCRGRCRHDAAGPRASQAANPPPQGPEPHIAC